MNTYNDMKQHLQNLLISAVLLEKKRRTNGNTTQIVADIQNSLGFLKKELEKVAEENPEIYNELIGKIKSSDNDIAKKLLPSIEKWNNEFVEKNSPDKEFFNLLRQEKPTQSQIVKTNAESDSGWHKNDKEMFQRRTKEALKQGYGHPDGDFFALLKATMPEKSEAGQLIEKLTKEIENKKLLKERNVRVDIGDDKYFKR